MFDGMSEKTYRLFGVKQSHKPIEIYCQIGLSEQTAVKFESNRYHLHSRK